MPVYIEKIKDKDTGKSIDKKVDGQKQYYIRTYITDEFGQVKQVTRHNKKWLGKKGYDLARQEEVRLRNGELIEEEKVKNITLQELKKLYLKYTEINVDRDTLISIENELNHFCKLDDTRQVKTYPNKPIRLFNKEIYTFWKKEMKEKKKKNGDLFSIGHLNKIHNRICAMIDFAIMEGYCTYNFASQSGKIGTTKEIKMSKQKTEYEVIDYNEYLQLMDATKDNIKYNTLFDLFFSCGPRSGEMRAFRVMDYSYEKKQLMVNHTLSRSNELKEPKTASSKAPIDLDDKLNEKIKKMIDSMKKDPDFNEKWYLFGKKYTPISSHAMEYNKEKYFKIANINKHLRLHDLRHSCATWLFSIELPINVVSRILRHNDVSTTMKTYIHLFAKDYENALMKVQEIKSQK